MSDEPLFPLRALGRDLTPDLIQGTYAALTPHRARLDPATTRADYDLAYGPDPRHRLDLYRPIVADLPRTVVVFLHGGGFAAGDKGGPEAPFFANIGAWAVSLGISAAAMTYRLVPQAAWPSGAEDVARAVGFLAGGAGRLLPETPRLILAGQSAGAAHIADYLAGRGGDVHPAVKGAVLMSGIHDFTRHQRMFFENGYYGADPADFARQSTLQALLDTPVPLMFTVSELDSAPFQRQAAHLVEAWLSEKGEWPHLHWLAGHNHVSPALYLGTPGDRLGPLIADFAKR